MWQMQYLRIHAFLVKNLRTCPESQIICENSNELYGPLVEGFYRTDILLFAAICENSLFTVLRDRYDADPTKCCAKVKKCFVKEVPKHQKVGESQMRMEKNKDGTPGPLGVLVIRFTEDEKIRHDEIKLHDLINGGEASGIYDGEMARRLHKLRDQRNTIHLGKHSEKIAKGNMLNETDRAEAEKLTEELRALLLDAWLLDNFPTVD